MTDDVVALWFVAVEIALRGEDDYSTDEAIFYGWWQDMLLESSDSSKGAK